MLRNTLPYLREFETRAIGFLFAVSSLMMGVWVAAIPAIRDRLGISEAALGGLLLFAPAGSLTGVACSNWLFKRIHAGTWMWLGSSLICLVYVAQVLAPNIPIFAISLFLNGLIGFFNGVGCNVLVDNYEKRHQRAVMSTSHGMYSVGGFISAGITALFYFLEVPLNWQIILMATSIISSLFLFRKQYQQWSSPMESGAGFQIPNKSVIGLAFLCFVSFMGEGCVADWSALHFKDGLQSSNAIAGLGFAGFSIAMAIGRLQGDSWIAQFGAKKMVIMGCSVAAFGFAMVSVVPFVTAALTGFTLVGFGFCIIVPILFSAAANIPGLSAVNGIAAVASGGLIGFLAGPSIIGLIATKSSVASGFLFVLILLLIAIFIAAKHPYLSNNKEIKEPSQHFQDHM